MVLAHDINEGQRTQDIRILEGVTFDDMLLSDKLLTGLKLSGFYKPSPIQLHGIPLGKCGFDLLLEAKSGTGKTAVFTVIALEKLDTNKGLQIVILAPTREIAAQICDVIKQIGSQHKDLIVEVVMGGLPVVEDISKFKKNVHIVVGSPGRLKHLVQDNHIDISAVRLLVLDEADKLMEKSFVKDINYIYSVLPKQKQVIMSSATYPESCKSFISNYVHNAQHICPDSNSVLIGITQQVTTIKHNSNIVRQTQHRFEELLKILTKKQFKQCLIFCNYQARVSEVHKMLAREKWPVELLYGQQEQTHRLDALKTLQEYKCRILISTDLAARGIDASNVDLVINFEPPFDWQTYLHRIGRAGRFGSYGIAITILSEGKEVNRFKENLSTLKVSLDLRYLWTNDKFYIDSLENHKSSYNIASPVPPLLEEKLITGDEYNDLWKAVVCENVRNIDAIHTFEELHMSFRKFSGPAKIESFSDLLCSFQQGDDTAEGDTTPGNETYKYMQFQEIPISGYLNYAQTENNIMSTIETNSINKITENNNEYGLQLHIEKHINSNAKVTSNIEKNYMSNKDIVNEIIHRNNSKNIKYTEYEDIDSSSIDIENHENKALLEAGLPTSFGKAKKSFTKIKHHSNRFHSYNDYHNKELYNSSDNDSINEKSTVNACSKPKTETRKSIRRTSLNKDDQCFSNHQSHQPIKTLLQMPYKYGNERKPSKHFRQTHAYSDSNSSNKHIQCERGNSNYNYNIWYNKLKAHMKHIEYALYIDEISKP